MANTSSTHSSARIFSPLLLCQRYLLFARTVPMPRCHWGGGPGLGKMTQSPAFPSLSLPSWQVWELRFEVLAQSNLRYYHHFWSGNGVITWSFVCVSSVPIRACLRRIQLMAPWQSCKLSALQFSYRAISSKSVKALMFAFTHTQSKTELHKLMFLSCLRGIL